MPSPKKGRRTPAEGGVWIFIFGDMCVFAVFFVLFQLVRISNPAQAALDQAALNKNFGAINTVLLLVSSLLVVLATRAVRSETQSRHAPTFISGAFICGAGFLAIKVVEYAEKVHRGITPYTSDFFMYYYVLTGLHAFHLLIGLVVLIGLHRLARKPAMSTNELSFFESGACFWHMVDLLWIVLFPLIFLVR
ncbi:cytochrome C oxidase subunit III [Mycobacterium sp. CBMA 234]|nr:cytochrome C oxidase subunit III [Mycolicibacterium sp. CBMA 234]